MLAPEGTQTKALEAMLFPLELSIYECFSALFRSELLSIFHPYRLQAAFKRMC